MEIAILIAVGVFGALLGAGIGLVLGRYVWPAAGGEVVAVLTERVSSLTRQLQEQGELRKQVTTEFENIANRFLDQSALKLSDRSKELLDPLRELLQKLQATRESEIRAVTELRTDIENVRKTSSDIGNQAEGLAKALRGNPQILGHWGEIQLEDILQGVGLEKDLQYIKQGKDLNLKSEDGGHQKPDFIVLLPEKRAIIVDSKVSLAAYYNLTRANDDATRSDCQHKLVEAFFTNIDDLSGKRYQENDKFESHDFVLMFVPIEGALAAALSSDREVFNYAWKKRVILAGPATVLMTMQTVASIWAYEDRRKNQDEIATLALRLCDKLNRSVDELNDARQQIASVLTDAVKNALAAHDKALTRLFTGQGNALTLGRRIQALSGEKGKKSVTAPVIDGMPVPDETDEEIPDEETSVSEFLQSTTTGTLSTETPIAPTQSSSTTMAATRTGD